VFVTASKTRGNEYVKAIQQKLPNIKYEFYNSSVKSNKHHLDDVRKHWSELDLLIYTSSITVGVNFDVENYFDNLYIYSSCKSSCVRDIFQSSMRVRNITSNCLYYQLYTQPFGLECDVTVDYDEVIENVNRKVRRETKMREVLKEEYTDDDVKEWKQINSWLSSVHIHNIFEDNVSKLKHRELFNYYLKKCNYRIEKNADDDKDDMIEMAEPLPINFIKYNDIDLSNYNFYDLKEKHKSEWTDEERNALCKFQFNEQMSCEAPRQQIYDFYHDPNNYKRSNYFNMLHEVRYINRIPDLRQKEQKDAVYAEFSKESSVRLQIIKDILMLLGVSSSTEIKQTVESDKLEKIYGVLMEKQEEWKQAFQIRDRTKEGKRQSKVCVVVGIISQIMKKWSGSTLKRVKRKRKMVKGKSFDCSLYGFIPELEGLDVIGMFS
jgi:hypothetical protein